MAGLNTIRLLAWLAGILVILNGLTGSCQSPLAGQDGGIPDASLGATFAPFCMTQEDVSSHQGRDGLLITLTAQVKTCRDSKGRTRTERSFDYHPQGGAAHSAPFESQGWVVSVADPAAGISMVWMTLPADQRRVNLNHVKPWIPHAEASFVPQVSQTWGEDESDESDRPMLTLEPLGVRSIQGVMAQGNHETHFHPAGHDGNNIAYSSTVEYWISIDYGLILEQKWEDAANGDRTLTLKSFAPGKPDASLFMAPEGYPVVDLQSDVP